MWVHKPTEKERAAEIDSLILSVAAHTFSHDEGFLNAVAATRQDPDAAWRLAGRYVRSGPGREVIARMLRTAARCPERMIETELANLGSVRVAVWSEAPLEPGDPQRDKAADRNQRGIELLARRGARRCLQCGAPNVNGYCSYTEAPASTRNSDRETLKNTVRALADAFHLATSGPKARRIRNAQGKAVR
jgi:hypothetical protein